MSLPEQKYNDDGGVGVKLETHLPCKKPPPPATSELKRLADHNQMGVKREIKKPVSLSYDVFGDIANADVPGLLIIAPDDHIVEDVLLCLLRYLGI